MQLNLKLPVSSIIKQGNIYTYWATFETDKFTADELATINTKILEVADVFQAQNSELCIKEISKNKNGETVTEFLDKMTRNVLLRLTKGPQKITLAILTNTSMYIF